MAENICCDSKERLVQQTLLTYGILPEVAAYHARVVLRNFTVTELSAIFGKLRRYGVDLRSFNLPSPGLVSSIARSVLRSRENSIWLKPSIDLIRGSVNEGLALCVNSAGDFSLRKDGYYAISHVWVEGIQADPSNRGVPLALVRQIIQRIYQVGATWIWLDGLAIPAGHKTLTAEEEELKISIINNLAAIYKRAESVIIFDAIAMQLKSTDYLDVAVCLSCGKWNTRIWTFQEIYLARKAIIITATGVVDFTAMVRRLCALAGQDSDLSELFGDQTSQSDAVDLGTRNTGKYKQLYLNFVRVLGFDGKKPSVTQIALSCQTRKTGCDIDYARAFFPMLGLTWKASLSREEGMELIYKEQDYFAKRLVLMHGSPRSTFRPGWAPSYLNGLMGGPIQTDHHLGDIEWAKRGLKRDWYAYKVRDWRPSQWKVWFLLDLGGGDSPELCACVTCKNERPEAIEGFQHTIARQCAYVLASQELTKLAEHEINHPTMLVERNETDASMNEAWVYLTAEIAPLEKSIPATPTPWLILHESPLSTHHLSGKGFSTLTRILSDESIFHSNSTPLHAAAQAGDEETLINLAIANTQYISARDNRGWTPLHAAAFSGQVSTIRALLSLGVFVDVEDDSERSSLMIAADEGHIEAVREMIAHGADVNLSRRNAMCPLNQALLRKHVKTVEVLLEAGANPNSRDNFFAPMLIACRLHPASVALASLLIAAGADPYADLSAGGKAIHYAARDGNLPLIEMLLNIDVPIDVPEQNGNTALYRAVEYRQEATVEFLLMRGANPNATNDNTWTCTLLGADIGNYEVLKMLVKGGANVNSRCQPGGWNALHIACSKGHRRAAKLLVTMGWDVRTKDSSGRTPLQLAQQAGHYEVVEVLRGSRIL